MEMDLQAALLLKLNSINNCLLYEKDANRTSVKFTDEGLNTLNKNAMETIRCVSAASECFEM